MFEDKVIPLDSWVSQFVDWLVENYRDFFQSLKWPVDQTLNGLDVGLNWLHPLIIIAGISFAAYRFSGKGLAFFSAVTLVLIGLLGLWEDTMTHPGYGSFFRCFLCSCRHSTRNMGRSK